MNEEDKKRLFRLSFNVDSYITIIRNPITTREEMICACIGLDGVLRQIQELTNIVIKLNEKSKTLRED